MFLVELFDGFGGLADGKRSIKLAKYELNELCLRSAQAKDEIFAASHLQLFAGVERLVCDQLVQLFPGRDGTVIL